MPQSENYVTPVQHRHLRACMVCSIVMTASRFRSEGCPNCEDFLQLQGSPEQIESCTSQVFDGLITLCQPSNSWVARWQRLSNCVSGVYAIRVSGTLPDEVKAMVEDETGQKYIPRDGTDADDGRE